MIANNKFTLPHPNNSTLNFPKKFTTPLPGFIRHISYIYPVHRGLVPAGCNNIK